MKGSIRQRTPNSWTVTLYLGQDESGKDLRKYISVKGTRADAETELARALGDLDAGLDLDRHKITVAELLARWLSVTQPEVGRNTYKRYEELARLHVIPKVGTIRLMKLSPLHVQEIYSTARKKGLSTTTVRHVHRVLSMALKAAVLWQLVDRNVCDAVKAPKAARSNRKPLELAQALELLESLTGELATLGAIAVGGGLRLGECLGLRWEDVDFEKGQLRVAQVLHGDMTFAHPKSHRSQRTIALPDFVLESLRTHRRSQNERRLACGSAWNDAGLVFDRGDGLPLRLDTTSKRFKRAADEAGVAITFHGLRHGHADLMLAAGVDMKVTSHRMGHSSISITADLYTHVVSKLDKQAAESLDRLFTNRQEG